MHTTHIQRGQLFGVFALLVGFAIWSPTGKLDEFPKYWWDEAFTVETARTFNEIGVFDMTVAPNTPSGIALALNANGFPLSFPLALLFRLTGVSVVAARLMMLGWMILLFGITYYLFKRYIGHDKTIAGLVIVATFASLYANGRTATGDIPGLLLFVLALVTLSREHYFTTGILTALALVTKTSSFHIAPIAIGLAILFSCGRHSAYPLMRYIFGGLCIALFWLWLLLPTFSWQSLSPAVEFFLSPTHKPALFLLVLKNPTILFNQSLLLVAGLSTMTYIALRKQTYFPRRTALALMCYTMLQIIVYLRSPGWSRYLFPVEFLLLLLLPLTLSILVDRYAPVRAQKTLALLLPISIAIIFSLHYQFFSNIFPRKNRDEAVRTITETLHKVPNSTIGFIDDPVTASLIPGDRKYQYIRIGGNTYAGSLSSLTDAENSPTFINSSSNIAGSNRYMLELRTTEVTLWRKK